jgi:Ni/Co efflux regulator RcnB
MMSHVLGTLAAAALPLGSSAPDQDRRPPDAHVLPGRHTDVVEEAGPIVAPDHYAAPVSGWRYRLPTIGQRLAAPFLAQRYRIQDPSRFELQRPTRGRAWIRYGNDLLLVRLATGEIIRIVRNGYRRAKRGQ